MNDTSEKYANGELSEYNLKYIDKLSRQNQRKVLYMLWGYLNLETNLKMN